MLRPLIFTNEELNKSASTTQNIQTPIKTYRFNIDTGEIFAEFIDFAESVAQAVTKVVKTKRDHYLIYSSNYGCELTSLLGKAYSIDYLELEIPRMINESLLMYDWFLGTEKYSITRENDELHISLTVLTNIGENIELEVAV